MGGGMTYTWKILDVFTNSENEISQIRYMLTVIDGENTVSTENYWSADPANPIKIFPEITETQVIHLIENSSQDAIAAIKSRLNEQLDTLKSQNQPIRAPWLGAETFTVQL
jgi:hypothetical protein